MRICELPGCNQTRPVRLPFCSGHYARLPKVFRRKLTLLRRPGQEYAMVQPTNQYLATVAAAVRWLQVQVEHKTIPGQGVLS